MPAPVIAAGIGVGGQLIGGLLSSKAQGKATDASLTANREAIAFQKQQQAEEKRRLASMWDAWYNRRRSLMDMYGLNVPEAQNPFMDASASAPGAVTGATPRGSSLADLVGRGKPIRGNPDRWME